MATKRLDELMTVRQIKDETGLPDATVRTICRKLVAVDLGDTRRLVFKRSDVERVLGLERPKWR